jgi:hypothetical protein
MYRKQIQRNFEKSLEAELKVFLKEDDYSKELNFKKVIERNLLLTSLKWKKLLLHGMYNHYYSITVEQLYSLIDNGYTNILNKVFKSTENKSIKDDITDFKSTITEIEYNDKMDKMITMVKHEILTNVINKKDEKSFLGLDIAEVACICFMVVKEKLNKNSKELNLDFFEIDYITTYSYRYVLNNELKGYE